MIFYILSGSTCCGLGDVYIYSCSSFVSCLIWKMAIQTPDLLSLPHLLKCLANAVQEQNEIFFLMDILSVSLVSYLPVKLPLMMKI